MCGIAGIYQLSKTPLPQEAQWHVEKMCAQLTHRGPDGHGILNLGAACFGHRRLAIIALHDGAQPMVSHDGKYAITFNGEIYNFCPLTKQLADFGCKFITKSDTEVILEAYRIWGPACVQKLEGMFAFALWDQQKRQLLLARDRFGKKPLFYTLQNGCCYFASEISALTCLPHLTFHLNLPNIIRFLAYDYVPGPTTIYTEIQSLLPAHMAIIDSNYPPQERYWNLPVPEPTCLDQSELRQELLRLFQNAVARRMQSDVPLGVFLSGGLDSSIVTGIMSSLSDRPIDTFSIGFEEASYNESQYARLVSQHFATNHHEEILSANACQQLLPHLISNF
ncbi:MAG: asparagine synthase (glutamine-hydrolyzing), partial [Desulfovibrio sp.]|nr:asparagine synthase (glutamine-hydrolyzing) [Desulfovibrio sp.]